MVIVDTSIWVNHFRKKNLTLELLLNEASVLSHSFVIGELACGQFKNRKAILSLLKDLPGAKELSHDEIMDFIEVKKLAGKGMGYVDIHILASALLSDSLLWSADRSLMHIATKLAIDYVPKNQN